MELVIRPAAILGIAEAAVILRSLATFDVSHGGVWSATPGLWQRYDRPWNGSDGTRGTAQPAGSIEVVYDSPRRNEITIYRAAVTVAGVAAGWSLARLCDDALMWAGLTLDTCPRAELITPPRPDPFRLPVQRAERSVPSSR